MIFPRKSSYFKKQLLKLPPLLIRDGGVIAEGYNAELDECEPFQLVQHNI